MTIGRPAMPPSRRGVAVFAAGVTALAMAAASAAWACGPIPANTWYADGSGPKSGPSGAVITAFATGTAEGSRYKLVAGRNTTTPSQPVPCQDTQQELSPAVRYSSAAGLIPYTSGVLNRPPGEYQVCFQCLPPNSMVTTPVIYTVL